MIQRHTWYLSIMELHIDKGIPTAPDFAGNTMHGHWWFPPLQIKEWPFVTWTFPSLLSHDSKWSHAWPSSSCITDLSVFTRCLSLRAPGWPAETDCVNFPDVQMTSFAIEGYPSLPLYIFVCWTGHWSHPIWTQSTLPTHPGRPNALYLSVTNLSWSLSNGMYMNPLFYTCHQIYQLDEERTVDFLSQRGFWLTEKWFAPFPRTCKNPIHLSSTRCPTIRPNASIW